MMAGSVAEQLAAEDRIIYAAFAAALIFAFAVWRLGRAYAGRGAPRHATAPNPSAGKPAAPAPVDGLPVADWDRRAGEHRAFDPAAYPWCKVCGQQSPCRTERRQRLGEQAGPIPAAGEVNTTDYVALVQQHQPCDGAPCFVHSRNSLHCRCGNAWPCPVVALHINPAAPIPGQRNRNPEGRWPS